MMLSHSVPSGKSLERFLPEAIAVIAAAAWLMYGPSVWVAAKADGIMLVNSYGAVLNVVAILTGFLTSFYGILLAGDGDFIAKVRRTPTFRRYALYLRYAIVGGAVSSALSLPVLIISPEPTTALGWENCLVSTWLCAAVYAFGSFWRVARSFFVLLDF